MARTIMDMINQLSEIIVDLDVIRDNMKADVPEPTRELTRKAIAASDSLSGANQELRQLMIRLIQQDRGPDGRNPYIVAKLRSDDARTLATVQTGNGSPKPTNAA